MAIKSLIKLVVIDIDGCLSPHQIGDPLDLITLHKIQEISMKSQKDPLIPKITLNTGRYLNYAEVFSQILGSDEFFLFEMGIGLGKCVGSRIIVKKNPLLTEKMIDDNYEFQRGFLKKHPEYMLYFQKYKQFSSTFIFESNEPIIEDIVRDIHIYLKENGFTFDVDVGHNFINLLHKGINKGNGFRFLVETIGRIKYDEIATIGDSNSDWEFMKLSGFKACPCNGSKLLKENVDFVASQLDVKGTLEILNKIIELNKDFSQQ